MGALSQTVRLCKFCFVVGLAVAIIGTPIVSTFKAEAYQYVQVPFGSNTIVNK